MSGKKERPAAVRTARFELRLSQDERQKFIELEKALGMTRSDIVRVRVLENSGRVMVNARDLLHLLDSLGAELGRAGNNINQLARHANILNRQGALTAEVASEFNKLLGGYIAVQQQLEKDIRQLIRLMRNQSL